jgi:hypothetical protein
LIAPAAKITSLLALAVCLLPFLINSTPSAFLVVGLIRSFVTVAFNIIWRLGRFLAGRRKALALLIREPFLQKTRITFAVKNEN